MPNEPPTLPVSTRTLSVGTFSTSRARPPRMPITPWQPTFSVQRSVLGSYEPIAERGSMGLTTMRLETISSRVTCAASAKAFFTASPSP